MSVWKVPFLSLKIENESERESYHALLDDFLDSGQFIENKYLDQFELKMSEYTGANYCLGVGSGTAGLYLALKCLDLSPEDEIIVPCLSWISTALVIHEIGAKVVFCDVKNDLTLCEQSVEKMITSNTKAIITVNYMGNMADYDALERFGLVTIEDASQSFGSQYKGRLSGSLGLISATSMNPMKSFGSFGESGLMCFRDKSHYLRAKAMRYCGMSDRETNIESSLNFRMDSFQAGVLLQKQKSFSKVRQRRIEIFKKYEESLGDSIAHVELGKECCPYGFTIISKNRDRIKDELIKLGIETKIQHQPLMCDQQLFKKTPRDVVFGKEIVKEILNLPLYENMSDEEVDYVISSLKGIL